MSHEPVDVLLRDDGTGSPIQGAVVKLFSEDGTRVYGLEDTDADGIAHFLLPAPKTYQARFYKFGVRFQNPIYIEVQESTNHWAPANNKFLVSGSIPVGIEATDSRLCCASGYFRTVNGAPRSDLDITFLSDFSPFVLEGSAVTDEGTSVRTDKSGFVAVNLIRHAKYSVNMEGWHDNVRHIIVPDRSSCSLPALLFPRVERVELQGTPPITVRRGQEVTVSFRVFLTDSRELDNIASDVSWTTEDQSIAVIVNRTPTTFDVRGLARGTTNILAARMPMCNGPAPVYYPDTPIYGVPVEVRVS